ncbi:uncharacterized protein isoform X3 [Danio rerio]|uniref:Uncharacterized protein isoform X3 n=7 Tax=Danio rerio TaxID=7955 RepID=A0AC58H6I8_DANRE
MKMQRGSGVMHESLFMLLLLSGLLRMNSELYRDYYFINIRMSWPEAQSYCRAKYTDLATAESTDDVNRLLNSVGAQYNGSVWIGLKRGTQKRWGWSYGDNTIAQYTAWSNGEPSSTNECGFLAYGNWRTYNCSDLIYFACYNGTGYTMLTMWMNWTDAQSYCRKHYIDLPTIHNSTELAQINSAVSYNAWLWIGLFKDSWEWSDKWGWFFRYWAVGQPSPSAGSSDCVGMSTTNFGKWASYSCGLQQPFICYGGTKFPYIYQYVNKSMTWPDAQSYCRARFTDLATVDTMDDVNRLVNIVDPGFSGSVWIGLQNGGQNRWIWSLGNGVLSTYSFWNPGEPSGDGDCGSSTYGNWSDESCSTVLPFLCFDDHTGFAIINTAMTWRDAQSYCRHYHTDLATIDSVDQQHMISTQSTLWIGLFLDSWGWSDQDILSFRYWAPDQPPLSSVSGDCAGLSTADFGQWAQYSCNLQQNFICYGDDSLINKQIVHIKLSCKDKCTPNDPTLQTAFLNKINEKLRSLGLERKSKISWKQSEDEEVFHEETYPPTNY